LAGTPVLLDATLVRALPTEAVRKGDVQGPMRERPGSAVEFAGGLDFHTKRGSGGPHRLDERLHPEDGDHPLQIGKLLDTLEPDFISGLLICHSASAARPAEDRQAIACLSAAWSDA
jgi:hypothetical protein